MKLKKNTPVRFTDPLYHKSHTGVWIDSYVLREVEFNVVEASDLPSSCNRYSLEDSEIEVLASEAPGPIPTKPTTPRAPRKVNIEARKAQLQKSLDHYQAQLTVLQESADLKDKKVQKELAKLQGMVAVRSKQIQDLVS